MNPEHDEQSDERDEQISAYLSGTMSPGEALCFERLLANDAALASEVQRAREALDAAREWVCADAPNAREQSTRLTIPSLARREASQIARHGRHQPSARGSRLVSGSRARPAFFRYLAAAALFAAGILVGVALPREKPVDKRADGAWRSAAVPGITDTTLPGMQPAATPVVTPRVAPSRNPAFQRRPALADAQREGKHGAAPTAGNDGFSAKSRVAPLRVREQSAERLVVESTLEGSGGRATWVLDGSFRLADTSAGGM
jgi:hypothetical protein